MEDQRFNKMRSPTGQTYVSFLADVKVGKPKVISASDFVGLWGYQRRGTCVIRQIENELNRRGLVCSPEIDKADYDEPVQILDQRDLSSGPCQEPGWPISSVIDSERELTSIGPHTPLCKVETIMVMRDFSQIPVLGNGDRQLLGTITWKTLARWSYSRREYMAKDAMTTGDHIASARDNLLPHIGAIISNDYIYIRGPDNRIVAILTATDLAEIFLKKAGAFIRIGEIEQRLRALVNRLPLPVLQAAKTPGDDREILDASDLDFGGYVAILTNRDNWDRVGLAFDRVAAITNLHEVNKIRNDVMHFRPRQLELDMEERINYALNWLRQARPRERPHAVD